MLSEFLQQLRIHHAARSLFSKSTPEFEVSLLSCFLTQKELITERQKGKQVPPPAPRSGARGGELLKESRVRLSHADWRKRRGSYFVLLIAFELMKLLRHRTRQSNKKIARSKFIHIYREKNGRVYIVRDVWA